MPRLSPGVPGTASSRRMSVRCYVARLVPERRRRIESILAVVRAAADDVVETMRDGMPTFERAGHWVAVASRRRHLSVHFSEAEPIGTIRVHHPELDCGTRCVRIRDSQHVPLYELERACSRMLGGEPSAPSRRS